MADVILDADRDAVEQPFLPPPLYFLELLLTLWDKMSQAVCLLGHFQGLCGKLVKHIITHLVAT